MSRLPPLRALEAFDAVARHLSVVRAAEELSVTPSAVSHRLRKLEDYLGVSLFHRTTRSIGLSDAGREYLLSIGSAFDRIERSSRRLASGSASDMLTVHCPPSFAPAWLLPRMADFAVRNPDIDLRVHASPEPVDFFRTDTDVEIRYGNADWSGLIVRPLMEDRVTALCTPDLHSRICDRPETERLSNVPLITSERALIDWLDWFRVQGLPAVKIRGPRFDRGYLALQAAALGLGVALESTVFAAAYLESGMLVRVFDGPDRDVVSGAHTLVYPPVHAGLRKISQFEEWMREQSRR